MSLDELAHSACNIARSLSVVGDRWTLMILHEMGIGACRFEVLQARTGMSPHLLAGRLRKLEEDDIVERRVYCARPVRYEYLTTAKGKDLDDVLLALRKWGMRWQPSTHGTPIAAKRASKPPAVFIGPSWNAPKGELFNFDNCILVQGPRWKSERANNIKEFLASKQISKKPERADL